MALSAERREARRRHLVDAAASLVRVDGGTGFSMLQLAGRAGVSPATPYNLIGSKSELLRLLVADVDLGRSEAVRRIWPFLRDRRIDAYADLLKRYRD